MKMRMDTTGWELSTDRLTVRVAKPGFIYRRTRFDWTGFVTDIILDKQHTFCSVESHNPLEGTGGIGLCNEFGMIEPVGYDDAEIGDCFPKIGIGLMKKDSADPFFFMKDYPFQPFSCITTELSNGLSWEVEPTDCNGYAARLVKTLKVSGNTIHIAYRLTNTGTKSIHTTEYNHNFVLIDHEPVGSSYRLDFHKPITFKNKDGSDLSVDGRVTWPDGESGFYAICREVPVTGTQSWELWNDKSGAGLRETLHADACRIALWGMPHVISPEMFKAIALEPGESDSWSRTYVFMTK